MERDVSKNRHAHSAALSSCPHAERSLGSQIIVGIAKTIVAWPNRRVTLMSHSPDARSNE
jgi:hypothetical protein